MKSTKPSRFCVGAVFFLAVLFFGVESARIVFSSTENGTSLITAAFADDDDDGDGDDDGDDDDDDDGDDDDDDDDDRPAYAPRELVIVSVSGGDLDRLRANGFVVLSRSRSVLLGETIRLRAPRGLSLARARARIRQLLPGAVVDFNHYYRPSQFVCDPRRCPAFGMIGWPEPPSTCAAPVEIGMIDTAVDVAHPALRGQNIEIVSLAAPKSKPRAEAHTHGTAVAALLAGRSDGRSPGLLPRARLVAVDAFSATHGETIAAVFDLVSALDALAERDVKVVNLSFAGPANAVFERAIEAAEARKMVLVAAAGNGGPRAAPAYPAAYAPVVAVTAVDAKRRPYRQANRGDYIDFAAPGVRIWTAGKRGGRFRSGTSYASPFVAAALAAGAAAAPDGPPEATLKKLESSAIDLGAPGRDPIYGAGLLQADGWCGTS